jgi:hypothetical protein
MNEAVMRQHKKWETIENGSVRQCVEWKSDRRTIGVEQGMGGSAEGNDGEYRWECGEDKVEQIRWSDNDKIKGKR